jgi:cytochrome c553/mono/diheme cytochrome c family protein
MSGPLRSFVVALLSLMPTAAFAEEGTAVEFFEKKIRPVLAEHCLKCHGTPEADGGRKTLGGGLKLTGRAAAIAGGETRAAIVPGDPAKSLLIETVKYGGETKMPPKGKLSDQQIADLTKWVKDGAVWPESEANPGVNTPGSPMELFTDEQKKFWAFQPIKQPTPPKPGNPIDAFTLAKLSDNGLSPAPLADRRTLIRRVTLDLTGLPPTPEQIDAFLADKSSNAWEKVIDRLLASSDYGERWGRHWLDVARYADSNGLDENTAFGNAWRYRDYVIKAFNADKPYDRFVKEQLAGDLLPNGGTDGIVATGFLVLGPKVLAEPDKQKMVMDIVDEQIDVVSKAFLGMTISCARCHDHKFDPIPTRDYYSLAGIFKSTKTMATLNTVAKAFERPMNGPESAETIASRTKLEQLKKDVKEIEKKFAATPETNKEKRQELHEQAESRRGEIKQLEAKIPPLEMALAVQDAAKPADVKVHIRGSYLTLGEVAPRVFPRIVAGEAQKSVPSNVSGRLQLAEWIASPQNPLTARVIVNRVWQHHFGEGIVRSPDNFGRLGERPTHPELLDWLADRFVKDGWSMKKLHKLILLSATYKRSTAYDAKAALADPENRLLWRFNRQRLEAEAIRDSLLFVAGTLDRTPGGSLLNSGNFEYATNDQSTSKTRYDAPRRSIYLPVIRNNVYDFFQVFDFVEPHVTTGKRAVTVVAPQALLMLNNPFVGMQAKAFAESLLKQAGTDEERVRSAYVRALGRDAKPEEVSHAVSFLAQYEDSLSATETNEKQRRLRVWQAWCRVLFASSEFETVD